MQQETETRVEQEIADPLTNMCNDLFREWLVDLTLEEKEIWLWNSSVLMHKIKQKRRS